MMHSLEVRSPFLDTAVFEFVNSLPDHLKLNRGRRKYVLKRLLVGGAGLPTMLPREIVDRPKKGFGIPIARWIKNDLRLDFHETLIDCWPETLGMFQQSEIRNLYKPHLSGCDNHYKELWALYVLAQWARRNL